MIYLLDVNALIAFALIDHTLHERVASWVRAMTPEVATCSITELGFVRVVSQASAYGYTVAHAREILMQLKRARSLATRFLADEYDISHLPAWVRSPKQVTDGHLSNLAHAYGAVLATLDQNIPGSYVIPKH
jgi:predicted nucleic acid-binding protein